MNNLKYIVITTCLFIVVILSLSVNAAMAKKDHWTRSVVYETTVKFRGIKRILYLHKLSIDNKQEDGIKTKYGVKSVAFVLTDKFASKPDSTTASRPGKAGRQSEEVRSVYYTYYAPWVYPHPIYSFATSTPGKSGDFYFVLSQSTSIHVKFFIFKANMNKSFGKYPDNFKDGERKKWPKATDIVSQHKQDMTQGLCGVGRIRCVRKDSELLLRADRDGPDCPSVFLEYNLKDSKWTTVTAENEIKMINDALRGDSGKSDSGGGFNSEVQRRG